MQQRPVIVGLHLIARFMAVGLRR